MKKKLRFIFHHIRRNWKTSLIGFLVLSTFGLAVSGVFSENTFVSVLGLLTGAGYFFTKDSDVSHTQDTKEFGGTKEGEIQ